MADPSLLRFHAVVAAGCTYFESFRQRINDLNVFPVADGDTGDNMALTLHAVREELERLIAAGDIDEIGRDEIVDSVARAALLGARGNSGVILSQLIRGAAEELISRPGELIDPVLVGAAMARAAERAYGSVRDPAEGTILTVVREMSHRIASELAHMPKLLVDVGLDEQDVLIAEVLEKALDAGQQSVRRGPDLLPVLKEAGVVDAGGYGLTVLFAGVIGALRGGVDLANADDDAQFFDGIKPIRPTHPEHESSKYRFCTNFAVTGKNLNASAWIERLEKIGDSVLVVGDHSTLRVHIHTDEPEHVTSLFSAVGSVLKLDVADMRTQVAERAERLAAVGTESLQKCGVLALVTAEGLADLFRSVGATPLDGGKTLNPSTHELLAGIHGVQAEEVVLLPNSPNVIMTAERAAELADKTVHVVPTRSQQAGLAAAVAFNSANSSHKNAQAMHAVLELVRTGAVTRAARDDPSGRFVRGDAVGFVDEDLVAWGSPGNTLASVFAELGREAELLSVIAGEGAPLDSVGVEAQVPDGVEVEYSFGGQPNYWWLIAAE